MSAPVASTLQGAEVSSPPAFRAASASEKSRRFGKRRSFMLLFLIAVCIVAAIDWFSASTQRLYLDDDSGASQQQGTAWQHFGLRGNEVVPEIITADEARFTFPIALSSRHRLQFT